LRPRQKPEELVYPGDAEPDSLHAGCFVGGNLVGIASAVRRPMPDRPAPGAWQLRGMAVLPEFRGKGLGADLLRACISHVARHGGTVLWCNARTPAAGFYRHLGFNIEGEEFHIPVSGPHFLMWRAVSSKDVPAP
jgi:ribosomal protein S18 acetylase RimI-like enzyme